MLLRYKQHQYLPVLSESTLDPSPLSSHIRSARAPILSFRQRFPNFLPCHSLSTHPVLQHIPLSQGILLKYTIGSVAVPTVTTGPFMPCPAPSSSPPSGPVAPLPRFSGCTLSPSLWLFHNAPPTCNDSALLEGTACCFLVFLCP